MVWIGEGSLFKLTGKWWSWWPRPGLSDMSQVMTRMTWLSFTHCHVIQSQNIELSLHFCHVSVHLWSVMTCPLDFHDFYSNSRTTILSLTFIGAAGTLVVQINRRKWPQREIVAFLARAMMHHFVLQGRCGRAKLFTGGCTGASPDWRKFCKWNGKLVMKVFNWIQ